MITLVLGGVRSGKSVYAERLFEDQTAVYIATAEPIDKTMSARIETHQERRGSNWQTIEAPIDLAAAIVANREQPTLVDCLGVWLGNLMHHQELIEQRFDALYDALQQARTTPLVLVSHEVGLGGIGASREVRAFADHLGSLNQHIAQLASQVTFVVAGCPTHLKQAPHYG